MTPWEVKLPLQSVSLGIWSGVSGRRCWRSLCADRSSQRVTGETRQLLWPSRKPNTKLLGENDCGMSKERWCEKFRGMGGEELHVQNYFCYNSIADSLFGNITKYNRRQNIYIFFYFKHSLCSECCIFLLGESPASEFYVPPFWNTLFHFHRWYRVMYVCVCVCVCVYVCVCVCICVCVCVCVCLY